MLVVDRRALSHVDRMAERVELLWTNERSGHRGAGGPPRQGVGANYQISTNTFLDNSGLRPITWIFDYLRALAYLVGIVAVTGLTLALAARARQHALDYHLARRMGLTRMQNVTVPDHRTRLAGRVRLRTRHRHRDRGRRPRLPVARPLPLAAAAPDVSGAAVTAAYTLVTAAVITAIGAIAVQRWYDRSNPAMLLRE